MVRSFLIYSMIDRGIDLIFDRIISAVTPLPGQFNVGDHFAAMRIRDVRYTDMETELFNVIIIKKSDHAMDVTYTKAIIYDSMGVTTYDRRYHVLPRKYHVYISVILWVYL